MTVSPALFNIGVSSLKTFVLCLKAIIVKGNPFFYCSCLNIFLSLAHCTSQHCF